MSAHPDLAALGDRLAAIGRRHLALHVRHLGLDACTEVSGLYVLSGLVALAEAWAKVLAENAELRKRVAELEARR